MDIHEYLFSTKVKPFINFLFGFFQAIIWTCSLLQIGWQYKLENGMLNIVAPDETALCELSHLRVH